MYSMWVCIARTGGGRGEGGGSKTTVLQVNHSSTSKPLIKIRLGMGIQLPPYKINRLLNR